MPHAISHGSFREKNLSLTVIGSPLAEISSVVSCTHNATLTSYWWS